MVLTIYFFSDTVGQEAWWVPLIVVIGGGAVIYMCKLAAVAYCLDACIRQYRSSIVATAPDVVIGYSWGGGIACSLLAKGFWTGRFGSLPASLPPCLPSCLAFINTHTT